MSKRNFHIDRLQIRMRGVSPETSRAAVGDLGHEILSQLVDVNGERRNVRITNLDAGKAKVNPGVRPNELRTRIASQVARSIKSGMKPR